MQNAVRIQRTAIIQEEYRSLAAKLSWLGAWENWLSVGAGRRHPVAICKASLRTQSIRRVCALRYQAGAQYSAVEYIRDKAAVSNVLAPAPNPEPASRLSSETRMDNFLRNASRWWRYVSALSGFTRRWVGTGQNG